MSNNTEPLDNFSLAIIFQLYIFPVWFSLEIIQVCSHLTNFSPSFAPFNGPFLLPIIWTMKQANLVETYSVRYSAHHHLHNVKQKQQVLIKRAKICEQTFPVS